MTMKTLKQFDDEKAAAWEKHRQVFDCLHPTTELRERTLSNNSLQLVRQCLTCGYSVGNPVKRAEVQRGVLPFDQALADGFEARRKASSDGIREKYNRETFFDAYGPYLASAAWGKKRELVFRRARGFCEGCGLVPPEEVHHLSYEHVGNEFLFELVAICHGCHERIHAE